MPRRKKRTPFGDVLEGLGVAPAEAAKELGITAAFARMLAAGTAVPRLKLAFDIDDWAKRRGSRCDVGTWKKYAR